MVWVQTATINFLVKLITTGKVGIGCVVFRRRKQVS